MTIPTDVFSFDILVGASESYTFGDGVIMVTAESGKTFRRVSYSHSRFEASGTIQFPQPSSGQTYRDLRDFWENRSGPVDPFLYQAQFAQNWYLDDAIGTGDTTTTDFALTMKHVKSASLVVKLAGVTQTLTTDYTFSGNDTAPTVSFVSAPGSGVAVTAQYTFYMPVCFAGPLIDVQSKGPSFSEASPGITTVAFSLEETDPGARFA